VSRRQLVAVSTAQLLAGIAGHIVAVRRGLAFDIAVIGWRGRPDRVAPDSWLLGTGLSAPVTMLAAQAAVTARLALTDSRKSTRALGVLGAVMIGGYLVEQEFRTAFKPSGWDRGVTPVAAAGFGLALPMAILGLQDSRNALLHTGASQMPGPVAVRGREPVSRGRARLH
jgi:hypothetical protein